MESNVTKNKTQAEMDANKRLNKKRSLNEVSNVKVPESVDLGKKRKLSEATPAPEKVVKATEEKIVDAEESTKVDKPWEGKEEQEEDYRWNVCENCQ